MLYPDKISDTYPPATPLHAQPRRAHAQGREGGSDSAGRLLDSPFFVCCSRWSPTLSVMQRRMMPRTPPPRL
eukprot:6193851-Pleurochrysis_carterae.AAC.2